MWRARVASSWPGVSFVREATSSALPPSFWIVSNNSNRAESLAGAR